MKLILPEGDYRFEDGIAEVKDGILYIYKSGVFKEVMYRLTYLVYGNDTCYYCHRKLRTNMNEADNTEFFSQITLDYVIPQDFGGPPITNNLRPACSECNSMKGNMYADEFEEYLSFHGKNDNYSLAQKRSFNEYLEFAQAQRKFGVIESLPQEWLTKETLKNIYVNFWIDQPLGMLYQKQDRFFKKYKRLPKPIVISKNKFLLDGFNTILLAKYNFNQKIDVIFLENVVFDGFPD